MSDDLIRILQLLPENDRAQYLENLEITKTEKYKEDMETDRLKYQVLGIYI